MIIAACYQEQIDGWADLKMRYCNDDDEEHP